MSNSIQITINTGSDEVRDRTIAELSVFGVDGFEEKEDELICYYTEGVVADADLDNRLRELGLSFSKNLIAAENWNATWESSFEPVVVEKFCTIRADFHKQASDTEYEIIITPKMSFGTGHHATTWLMVQQMAQLDFKGKMVADFGTGTGVLSILANKLGSTYTWAIDNDNWSIENARENIERNNCYAIRLEKADVFKPSQQFDIILANINRNTILNNLGGLVFGLKRGATLLLSGLLKTDESAVTISCQKNNLLHVKTVEKDNWISMIFTNT